MLFMLWYKSIIQFEDIQKGNAVLLSQDDYQNKMSSFVKELETKYADS
jgi:hypothetical protein